MEQTESAARHSFAQGPSVTELAKQHQLGICYGAYHYRTTYQFATFITITLAAVIALFAPWLFLSSVPGDFSGGNTGAAIVGVVFSALFGLIGIVYLWISIKGLLSAWRLRGSVIHLYKEGLILATQGKRIIVRWDNVSAFWQSITRRYVHFIPTRKTYFYKLRTTDNMEYSFGENIADIAEMGGFLSQEVTRVLLQRAVAAYEAGESLSFGKFSVSKQGIGIGKGKKTLSWSDIKSIKVRNDRILVKKRGQWLLNWSTARVSKTPNALVFVALVNSTLEQSNKIS